MSTTIEDKINLFANVIFEKVEKQSEEKLARASRQIDEHFFAEKDKTEEIARQMREDRVKKSDAMCKQIISRSRIEAKQGLYQKKQELVDRTIENLRVQARNFLNTQKYADFLRNAICRTITGFAGEQQLLFYFTSEDLKNYTDLIRKAIMDCLSGSNAVYTLHETEDDIIGGCFCTNEQKTKRAVCTLASLLEDNQDRIGQIVMENLQVQVVS